MAEDTKPAAPATQPETNIPSAIASTSEGNSQVTPNKGLGSIFDKMEANVRDGKPASEGIKPTEPAKSQEKVQEPASKTAEAKPNPEEKKTEPTSKQQEPEKKPTGRDALNKLLEAKPQDSEKPKEADPVDEVPEEELKVLPTDKDKTAKRIRALLKKIDDTAARESKTLAEFKDREAKLASLQAEYEKIKSTPQQSKKQKAALEELRQHRRLREIEKDPEIKNKFDPRAEASEKAIIDVLKSKGAGDPLLKMISEEGGFTKFSQSNRVTTIPSDDGEGVTHVTCAQLADIILNKSLNLGERKAVEAAMLDQISVQRERQRFIEEAKSGAAKYFADRDAQLAKEAEENRKIVESNVKAIEKWQGSFLNEDWIKDQEIPSNASPSERSRIEGINKYNAELRDIAKKAIGTKDLGDLLKIVEDHVKYFHERRVGNELRRELESSKQALKAKQEELDKLKNAARAFPRSGSIASGATQQTPDAPAKVMTLSERLDEIQRKRQLVQTDE